MRWLWPILVVAPATPVAAEPLEACVAAEMAAFEDRLTAALNAQAAPNFDLVDGAAVGDCAGIAMFVCEGAACDAVRAQIADIAAGYVGAVPEPAAVRGRNPVWSDGLYPRLWSAAVPGEGTEGLVAYLAAAAGLWQVARAIGVVE